MPIKMIVTDLDNTLLRTDKTVSRFSVACDFGSTINEDFHYIDLRGADFAVIDEVKAFAAYVCDSSNNDGVAKWIEENVFA